MDKLVVGNLKMNLLSPIERERYLHNFKKELGSKRFRKAEIILCPSHVHLENFKKNLNGKIGLGGQNMFWKREGSFTGEISPAMLKNFGCEYVIVGHSERKRYFCETNEEINMKVAEALKIGLKPIICIGETRTEKEANQTLRVVTRQLSEALSGISRTKASNIVVTYEPVWAVGTDDVPTAHDIMEAKVLIRKILVELFTKKYAQEVKILYGGSVSSKTVREVCIEPGMDGALIGRESLTPFEFIKIAEIIND